MDANSIRNIIQTGKILGIAIKLGGLVLSTLYILFQVIIIKQIKDMKQIFQFDDKDLLLQIAYVQLILALFLFLIALLFL